VETAWPRELLKTRFHGSNIRWGGWMGHHLERAVSYDS
jgi:hypothetical protein